jgi:hypothetical protein
MSTTLETACPWKPVPPLNWRCNGGINPLIRTFEQFTQVAGSELHEALRWALIGVQSRGVPETAIGTPAMLFAAYRKLDKPAHQELLPGISSPGQYLAKHGNLQCRAQCADLEDLLQCFRLVGSYNGWEHDKGIAAFRVFHAYRYLNADNPNNGGDAFTYHFGWEGSHVVYIEPANHWYGGLQILDESWSRYREVSREEFAHRCRALGRRCNADESDACEDGWRLWWD